MKWKKGKEMAQARKGLPCIMIEPLIDDRVKLDDKALIPVRNNTT